MSDENAANFIVEPLLMLGPILTFGLIEFSDQSQTFLISVMSKFVLKQALIEIVPLKIVFRRVRELAEKFLGNYS